MFTKCVILIESRVDLGVLLILLLGGGGDDLIDINIREKEKEIGREREREILTQIILIQIMNSFQPPNPGIWACREHRLEKQTAKT